jgi:hypothetical protein
VEVIWSGAAKGEDTLVAEAEVIAITEGMAGFSFSARTAGGRRLLTGKLRLRALRDGKALPYIKEVGLEPLAGAPVVRAPGVSEEASWLSVSAPPEISLGRTATVSACLRNTTAEALDLGISLDLPPGKGLSLETGEARMRCTLPPGSAYTAKWVLRGDRPHEVNLNRPWQVELGVWGSGIEETRLLPVRVADPNPGRIFYILNEDCETFDGGPLTGNYGASSVLGNANNFMDPEDYRVQMIAKPDRMNEIADRYGACWTHFWCVPQRFAAGWAASRSATGAWPRLLADLDAGIRRGSLRHEYAPHIHYDYEPDSSHPPQPRLVYDSATDGILPNDYYHAVTNPGHQYHDWDGAGRGISYVKRLGGLEDVDSKAGSLYKCLLYLSRMQVHRRYPLLARTGGFDFGVSPGDQRTSTAAYEMNGLRGNADARFVGAGAPPRGKTLYWCQPGDRMREVERLDAVRLVQLADTFETDFHDVAGVNGWFAGAVAAARGCGVHVVAAMAHAMFLSGEPDPFRSLEGGSFGGLEQHLAWVTANYPEVEFATASDALVEYLDYYTPVLDGHVSPELCGGNPAEGRYEYPVRLLGRGIRVDERHPASLTLPAPPWFAGRDVERLRVLAGGAPVAEQSGFPEGARPSIPVTLTNRPADLRLEVVVPVSVAAGFTALLPAVRYREPREAEHPPLLQLTEPENGRFTTDLLRLLMNPVAGGDAPLGRRVHPLGVFVMGAALTAALEQAGPGHEPRSLRLGWRKMLAMDSEMTATCTRLDANRYQVLLHDQDGDLVANSEVELAG